VRIQEETSGGIATPQTSRGLTRFDEQVDYKYNDNDYNDELTSVQLIIDRLYPNEHRIDLNAIII